MTGHIILQDQAESKESGSGGQGVNILCVCVCVCSLVSNLHVHSIIRWIITITSSGHTQDANRARSDVFILIHFYVIPILFSSSFFLFIPASILCTHKPYTFISCSVTAFSIEYNGYTLIPNSRKHLHFQNKQQIYVKDVFAGILAINIFFTSEFIISQHMRRLCRNNILIFHINN